MGEDALFVETLGSGPPMLVLHGGLGWDHTYFRPWLDALAEDHTLVYYDHLGNGRSPAPEAWTGVSHATWADGGAALLERLDHVPATILGHSYGGFLALELALRHPELVERLILVDAAPALDYPAVVIANASDRGTPEQVGTVTSILSEGVRDDRHLEEVTRAILPLYFESAPEQLFERVMGDVIFSAAAMNHAFGACLPVYDVEGELGRIEVPALVLVGRHDWICPVEQGARRLEAGLPEAELVVFERSGHFPFIEEPDAFLEAVREWERRLE